MLKKNIYKGKSRTDATTSISAAPEATERPNPRKRKMLSHWIRKNGSREGEESI